MQLRGVLAFFLVIVAAALVVFLVLILTRTSDKIDPGTIALFASFVTMFIKMASDGVGYQFQSSAGSEKKDEVSAVVAGKLADKVSAAPLSPAALEPSVVVAWWSVLSPDEKMKIEMMAARDDRVASFVTNSKIGKATKDDLAYLVSLKLITEEREKFILTV